MYKGITPTLIFKLKDIDLNTAQDIAITFSKIGCVALEKGMSDMTITENQIELYLSQEETLSLPTGMVMVQVNILFTNGVRGCTKIMGVRLNDNLKDEVMS